MRNRPFGRFAAHPSKQDGGVREILLGYAYVVNLPCAHAAPKPILRQPHYRRRCAIAGPLPIKVIIAGYGYISADYFNVALCAIGGHSRR